MINEMYVHTCNSNVELIAKPIVMQCLPVTKPMVLNLGRFGFNKLFGIQLKRSIILELEFLFSIIHK